MLSSQSKPRLSKSYADTDSAQLRSLDFKQFSDSNLTCKPALLRRTEWEDKEYREAYMEAAIEQGVAWQIRINRKLRGWSQAKLAEALGTGQSAVSRLEDPSYGGHSLDTLIKVANAFDCALSVKLVSFSQLAFDSERLGEAEQCAMPFSIEWEQIHGNKENSTRAEPPLVGRTYILRRSTGDDPHWPIHNEDHTW